MHRLATLCGHGRRCTAILPSCATSSTARSARSLEAPTRYLPSRVRSPRAGVEPWDGVRDTFGQVTEPGWTRCLPSQARSPRAGGDLYRGGACRASYSAEDGTAVAIARSPIRTSAPVMGRLAGGADSEKFTGHRPHRNLGDRGVVTETGSGMSGVSDRISG